jgi:hypothetical protein
MPVRVQVPPSAPYRDRERGDVRSSPLFFRSHTVTNHTSQKSTESPHPPFLDRGGERGLSHRGDQFFEAYWLMPVK